MPREFMPILRHPEFRLPWALIAPHEKQALRNHGQTLEGLAERGGLGFTEALAIMCDLPFERVRIDEQFNKNWLEERIAAAAGVPEGDVVVTKNPAGQIVAVTRQDAEGRILKVIAESADGVALGDAPQSKGGA